MDVRFTIDDPKTFTQSLELRRALRQAHRLPDA